MSPVATANGSHPPTREIGTPLAAALPSWSALGSDLFGPGMNAAALDREYVPELRWPNSVRTTYPRMGGDSQLDALMRGTILPISRYQWALDPNGARPELVTGISVDFNLPLVDSPAGPVGRARARFAFARHRDEAMDTALRSGHAFYQQVGTILPLTEAGDGLWHLRKLSPRPPWTLAEIRVADDGGLLYVRQHGGPDAPTIPVDELVGYVWNPEPGSWLGRSMFRACYREWLIKDRLLRVDARNHEKGGGIWWGESHQGATVAEKTALSQLVGEINAVQRGEIAVPAGDKLHLERPGGGDTAIGSINRHDEAMARSFLLMLIQLGQTSTGSRAVGDNFTELWQHSQQSVATWFRDVFNEHVVEDWVDWNYGPGEEFVPRLVFSEPASVVTEPPSAQLDPATKAALVGESAATVARLRLKDARERTRYRAQLARVLPALDWDGEEHLLEEALRGLEEQDEVEHALHALLARPTRVPGRTARAESPIPLPPRTLRRQPNEHEIRAQVDFAAIETAWQNDVAALVAAWRNVRAGQVGELRDLIAAAEGDLARLAAVEATAAGADIIVSGLARAVRQGAAEAAAEAQRQGVAAITPDVAAEIGALASRAEATATLLTRSISEAGGRKAVQLSGGTLSATEVADEVAGYLDGLSDAYLEEQFGGAVSAAVNAGRIATMAANGPASYYASELLDTNCCAPCVDEDGTEFESLDDAARDYPSGGYKACAGGPRCRGTLVAVYDEAPATL